MSDGNAQSDPAEEPVLAQVSAEAPEYLGRWSQRWQIPLFLLALCVFPFIARRVAEPGLRIKYDEKGMSKLERHIEMLLEEGFAP